MAHHQLIHRHGVQMDRVNYYRISMAPHGPIKCHLGGSLPSVCPPSAHEMMMIVIIGVTHSLEEVSMEIKTPGGCGSATHQLFVPLLAMLST